MQNDTRSPPPRLLPGPCDGRPWVIASRRVSVAVVLSHGASTRLAFSTREAHAVVAAVAAQQCLQEAVDEHNATGWWQWKVRLVDEPAVREVASPTFALLFHSGLCALPASFGETV